MNGKSRILPIAFMGLFMTWTGNVSTAYAETSMSIDIVQQIKHLKGKVVDDSGEPIIGANILIKGTTNGTITDIDGNFTLDVQSESAILVCSYIGYISKEIPIGNQTSFNIKLQENSRALDEVVVIGYGSTSKKELTGSVTQLNKDEFKVGNISDPALLLQGKIAGLTITQANGADPTGEMVVQLRGLNSMTGGVSPLIVIDGVAGGSLASLSAEDIESIDVLKDGSAAAIYGTRGTNGVILVTTRRGESGKSTIELSSYLSAQTLTQKPKVMSAGQFRQALKEFMPEQASSLDYGANTDWWDEITNDSPLTQHYSLSTSGGNNKLTYRGTISWHDEDGIIKTSTSNMLRTRFNVTQRLLNDKLKLDYNFAYASGKKNKVDYNTMLQATLRNPTEPVYDTEGKTPISGGYYYNPGPFAYYNPVAMLNESTHEITNRMFSGSANASFQIIEELKVSVLASLRQKNTRDGYYQTKYYPINYGTNGKATVSNYLNREKSLELTAEFSKLFGEHKIQAVAGYSYYDNEEETYGGANYLFDTDFFSFYNMGAGSALSQGKASMNSFKSSNKLISFFGRVMYNFKERYLLSVSLRHEGSTRFGKNNKWGDFPAISAGWRLNEEEFMKDIKWIDDLKLRAGFGVTGNQDIDNYQSLERLTQGQRFYYNGSWIPTVYPSSNPNPNLKWEKKNEFNIGIDFSVLNGRINGTIDYYNRRTKDLLYTYSVPVPPNVYNSTLANVGQINNKGLEIAITAIPVKAKSFTWSLTAIFSRNTNKLASFSNQLYEMSEIYTGYDGDDIKTYTQRIIEGESIGNFYGLKWLGFSKDGSENIYEDIDGKEGITDNDRQVIGNAYPDFTYSLQNTFTYKHFDLSFLLRGSQGNDVLNISRLHYEGFGYFGGKNVLSSTLDYPNYQGGVIYSSRFVEDGSYLKLDNVTLGYNVPIKKNDYLSKVRIYLTGQNLFTITKYKGIDPEISLSGLEPGIDWATFYPRTRTFTFGVNITF